ncbi:hypothetical protein ACFWPQ_51655 [Streptomyces sp. NPDC058464]|uniref:hypothetical protein n=1 Tax=Streptomyces sp. NPDC058464 TaxID=3346511 RepID=UPI0036619C6E
MTTSSRCVVSRRTALGMRPWAEEFVLGLLVELLPAGHPGGVDLDDAVADCLFRTGAAAAIAG